MKRTLLFVAAVAVGFILWQWWISRRDPDAQARDRDRLEADRVGRAGENAAIVNAPRRSDDARRHLLDGFLRWLSPVVNVPTPDAKDTTSPNDCFIFGYPATN